MNDMKQEGAMTGRVTTKQNMCKTCQNVVVQEFSGGYGNVKCVNCWEVEHRICAYIRSPKGLRKVMAAIHNELSNDTHFEGL